MRVTVVCSGYVGLITGTSPASLGHKVTIVEIFKEKVDRINAGIPPIYELGLLDLLKKVICDAVGTLLISTMQKGICW